MLKINNLFGGYTQGHDILQGVDLEVSAGDSVGIIGLNGSGKSTFAKAIINCLPYRNGSLFFNGRDISQKSTCELSQMGIVLFLQGGRIFEELSVYENLLLAAKSKRKIDEIKKYKYFDDIVRLSKIRADKLSGGERHRLALKLSLAMCVLKDPALLILDEPSASLSPLLANEMYQTLDELRQDKKRGLSIILVEQNVVRAIDFCSSVIILENGKIAYASAKKSNEKDVVQISDNKSYILKNVQNIMFHKKIDYNE